MSEENVEVVRHGFDLFLGGDFENWLQTIDPDVGWDFSTAPLPDVRNEGRGRDAFVKMLNTYMSGFTDYESKAREFIDAGDNVVVVVHETVRMGESEAFLDRDLIHVWTVRDGRSSFLRIFRFKAEALAAVGLSE